MDKLNYDTKCRACNTIMTHVFKYPDQHWEKMMSFYVTHPRSLPCSVCERETIQELVSQDQVKSKDSCKAPVEFYGRTDETLIIKELKQRIKVLQDRLNETK